VDRTKEHLELRYGSAEDHGWDEWTPVAVIGPPADGAVKVQFLVDRSDPSNADAVSYAAREIQFYLIDKGEPNPWAYAKYHCGTSANVYSKVHWSFWKPTGKMLVQARERGTRKKAPKIPRSS
jgi:hypothetical protein